MEHIERPKKVSRSESNVQNKDQQQKNTQTQLNKIYDYLDNIADNMGNSSDSVTYTLSKNGTTITLTGSDGSTTTAEDSDTHYSAKTVVCSSSSGTTDGSASNGNVYLNLVENGSVRNYNNIYGSGGIQVTSNSAGHISIDGSNVSGGSTVSFSRSETTGNTIGTLTINGTSYVLKTGTMSSSGSYLPLSGGTLTGSLTTRGIFPSSNGTYNIGSISSLYDTVYSKEIWASDYISISGSANYNLYRSGTAGILGTSDIIAVRDASNVNTSRSIQAKSFDVWSSKRYKENIRDITEDEANKILDINTVKFDYKHKENGTNLAGVIAEDVYEILPEVVSLIEIDGKEVPNAVDYSKFVPYLIKKLQMQQQEINELKEKIK